MVCRLTRLEPVKHTRFVHGQTYRILRPLLLLTVGSAGILIDPDILFLEGPSLLLRLLLLLLLRRLIALISRTLATAGAPLLFLHGCYLCCAIPIIRPLILPLIPVIRAIKVKSMKSFTTNGDFYPRIPTQRFRICWHIIKMLAQSIVASIQTSSVSLKSIKSIKKCTQERNQNRLACYKL
jgi:hypothetical protein